MTMNGHIIQKTSRQVLLDGMIYHEYVSLCMCIISLT